MGDLTFEKRGTYFSTSRYAYHGKPFLKYKNTSSSTEYIYSYSFCAASGDGVFNWNDYVYGDGQPITFWVNLTTGSDGSNVKAVSQEITISATMTPSWSGGRSYPDRSVLHTHNLTITFATPWGIAPNEEVYLCFCFDGGSCFLWEGDLLEYNSVEVGTAPSPPGTTGCIEYYKLNGVTSIGAPQWTYDSSVSYNIGDVVTIKNVPSKTQVGLYSNSTAWYTTYNMGGDVYPQGSRYQGGAGTLKLYAGYVGSACTFHYTIEDDEVVIEDQSVIYGLPATLKLYPSSFVNNYTLTYEIQLGYGTTTKTVEKSPIEHPIWSRIPGGTGFEPGSIVMVYGSSSFEGHTMGSNATIDIGQPATPSHWLWDGWYEKDADNNYTPIPTTAYIDGSKTYWGHWRTGPVWKMGENGWHRLCSTATRTLEDCDYINTTTAAIPTSAPSTAAWQLNQPMYRWDGFCWVKIEKTEADYIEGEDR